MSVEEHIDHLDQEVKEVKNKVEDTLEVLGHINEKLKKLEVIEQGIFGNEKLEYPGIIKTIATQQTKIDILEKKILEIEKLNREYDLIINTRSKANSMWFGWGKMAIQTIVQAIIIYLILKGFISADAALATPEIPKL